MLHVLHDQGTRAAYPGCECNIVLPGSLSPSRGSWGTSSKELTGLAASVPQQAHSALQVTQSYLVVAHYLSESVSAFCKGNTT